MSRAVFSLVVIFRSPFTATVSTMPSLAALPPNMPTMRPSGAAEGGVRLLLGAHVGEEHRSAKRHRHENDC